MKNLLMNLSEKVVIRPYDENQGGDLLRDQVERLTVKTKENQDMSKLEETLKEIKTVHVYNDGEKINLNLLKTNYDLFKIYAGYELTIKESEQIDENFEKVVNVLKGYELAEVEVEIKRVLNIQEATQLLNRLTGYDRENHNQIKLLCQNYRYFSKENVEKLDQIKDEFFAPYVGKKVKITMTNTNQWNLLIGCQTKEVEGTLLKLDGDRYFLRLPRAKNTGYDVSLGEIYNINIIKKFS